jgi:hypothetical protein
MTTPRRKPYTSDVSDAQWQLIGPFVIPETGGGRPRTTGMRESSMPSFYVLRTRCAWHLLPHDLSLRLRSTITLVTGNVMGPVPFENRP